MGEEGAVATTSTEMARLQVFDGTLLKVSELVIAYSNNPSSKSSSVFFFHTFADPSCIYKTVEEFLAGIRKKFRERDEESAKVVELKKLE